MKYALTSWNKFVFRFYSLNHFDGNMNLYKHSLVIKKENNWKEKKEQ